MNLRLRIGVGSLVFAALSGAAHADQIYSSSYNEPNGEGQVVGGNYNYWDGSYTGGTGNPTEDGYFGSYLSGGSGQLTNGQITEVPWYDDSNDEGTGAYVGWFTFDPVITFNFSSDVTIDTVELNMDASAIGGVYLPADVVIDGTSYSVDQSLDGSQAPIELTFSGLDLTGNSLTIELDRRVDPNYSAYLSDGHDWVFLNQAQFFGPSSSVPAPAALGPFAAGLIALGRKRRK